MACKIYNSSLVPQGIISHIVSIVWREGYRTVGELQLVVNKNSATIPLIKKRNFVGIDESDTLMFIHSVQDSGNQLWAYGIEAKGLLAGRVYPSTFELNNTVVETSLRTAISTYGDIPCMELGTLKSLTGRASLQRTYGTLEEISRVACEAVGYGYTLRHDKAAKKLKYELRNGQTRSGVKFATKYGNLTGLSYSNSEKDFANFAYVAGSGEGDDRIVVSVDQTGGLTGFDKRTIWVDAKDIAYDEETMTHNEYKQKLTNRGLEKLREKIPVTEITFDVSATGYGRDYWLGDTVTVDLPEYGLAAQIDVAEVEFTIENGTKITRLTLGTPIYSRRG